MVMPNSTTNLPNGVTNVLDATAATLGSFRAPDPTRLHTWFDDFDDYTTAEWVITSTGSSTIAVQNEDGGVLKVTTGASEDDGSWFQWSGNTLATVAETFKWEAGRGLWFKARLKVDDITESDYQLGLIITDTTPLDASDGFWFVKVDGATALNFKAVKNSTATTLSVGTPVADTYFTIGFWWDPDLGVLTVYYNDNPVASTTTTTNFCDDEELAVSFGILTGEGNACSLSLDYLLVAKDRQATVA